MSTATKTLTGLVAGLSGALAFVWFWPMADDAPEFDAIAPEPIPLEEAALPEWPDPGLFDHPVEQSQSNAPAVSNEPVAIAPRPELIGIVRDSDGYAAWLRTDDRPAQRVGDGDAFAGWRVDGITETELVIRRDGEQARLRLFGGGD